MPEWAVNYNFKVFFGPLSFGFSKITGLSQELEYDSIEEGGRNWAPVLMRKAKAKQELLVLEHGIRTGPNLADSLGIRIGMRLIGVSILIMNQNACARTYFIDSGIITKLQLEDLDAMGRGILIERMEIAHNGIACGK